MTIILRSMAISTALLIGWIADSPAQPITPEMFGALPAISDVDISPDGRTLAVLRNVGEDAGVVFHDLENAAAPPVGTRLENAAARYLQWANDSTVLLMVSQSAKRETIKRRETLQAWRWLAISRDSLESRVIFGNEPGLYILSAGSLLASIPEDPDRVVFSRWTNRATFQSPSPVSIGTRLKQNESSGGIGLFSVQLDKGQAALDAAGNPDTAYWIVDRDGTPLARVDLVNTSGGLAERRIYTRNNESNAMRLVQTLVEPRGDNPAIILRGLSAATGSMLATAILDDKHGVIEFDMETGEVGADIYRHPTHDIAGVIYDVNSARIRGVRLTEDLPQEIYFDPAEQRFQAQLAAALPGAAPVIWSRSADDRRSVVKAIYSDRPAQWHLFDSHTRSLSPIGSTYPALDGRAFATKERYEFEASDGLRIPGYLTIPAGVPRDRLPMVVLPHGGPWARDDQSFDWWGFFYAARGYLVYQPNFRGSTGYGEAFRAAGDGEWGGKMQQDIVEGVQSLIAQGVVDPARICIVGASYGGYAALTGATLTPDLYACAISVNGISSIGDLIASRESSHREHWEARIGSLARSTLHELSPAHQAHKAKAPILLLHAREDTVVPVGQSRGMAKALARHRKPHRLVELRGEDHWLSYGSTRTEMLKRSIEFIDQHIGQPVH